MRMPRLAGEARTGDDDESSEPVTSLRTRGELVAVDNAGCPKPWTAVDCSRCCFLLRRERGLVPLWIVKG